MRTNYGGGRGNRSRDSYGRFTDNDRNYDDYNAYENRGRGHGGWFDNSEEHSEAAERGWNNRGGGYDRDYDYDEDRNYGRGRGHAQGGWFGDSEGHSEAAERGWGESRGGARRSRSYNDEYENEYSGEGQGWHGDPEGHAEAAERGWQHRRGGSRRGSSNRNYRGSSHGSYSSSRGTSRRGFASMDPEEQREIASMGGRAAHEYGTAHEWNSREAARAGHLGGIARWGSSRSRRHSNQY